MIPQEINHICFAFYFYAIDKFNKEISSDEMVISEDGSTIEHLCRLVSAFGEELIESVNNDTIYIWTFKVIQSTLFYAIGITSGFNESGKLGKDERFDHHKYSYLYNGFNGALSRRTEAGHVGNYDNTGPRLEANDIVEMKFDVGKGYLSYKINEVPLKISVKDGFRYKFSDDPEIAFDSVEKGEEIKYRMAFSCYGDNDSIKILSFELK